MNSKLGMRIESKYSIFSTTRRYVNVPGTAEIPVKVKNHTLNLDTTHNYTVTELRLDRIVAYVGILATAIGLIATH